MRKLETERLRLRPFTWEDRPLILSIASDPGTVKYLFYWGRDGITPEGDADRFLRYAIGSAQEEPIRSMEYCLVRKADGVTIGDGSIELLGDKVGEIGWILLPEHRGQGYVTEMGRELLRYGFEEWGLERIIAHCDARNAPSYHVMERLGMRLEQIVKGARPAKTPDGEKGDECTYGITKAEWAAGQKGA